jgi:purine-cytosine permease-like protein
MTDRSRSVRASFWIAYVGITVGILMVPIGILLTVMTGDLSSLLVVVHGLGTILIAVILRTDAQLVDELERHERGQ